MADEKNNSELKTTAQILKSSFQSSFKAHKALWIFSAVVFALLLIVGCAALIFTTNDKISTSIIVSFLPEKVHMEKQNEYNMDFYREKNEEFFTSSKEERKHFNPFNVYYYNEAGEKVYLEDEFYYYTSGSGQEKKIGAYYDFLMEGMSKLRKVQSNLKTAAWILAALVVVAAIFIWYKFDKKQYENSKPKFNRRKKRNNKTD